MVSSVTWEFHDTTVWGGCGAIPRSMATPQWPKPFYQLIFYHDITKIPDIVPKLSLLQHGHTCITRNCPMRPGDQNVFQAEPLVTRVIIIVMSQQRLSHIPQHTINKSVQNITIVIRGQRVKIHDNVGPLVYLPVLNWPNLNRPVLFLIFVIIIVIHVCFL